MIYADYAIGRFDLYGASASPAESIPLPARQLEVDILLPGHNQIAKDLPADYIARTAKTWEPYLT